jgi:hypothetical protein
MNAAVAVEQPTVVDVSWFHPFGAAARNTAARWRCGPDRFMLDRWIV